MMLFLPVIGTLVGVMIATVVVMVQSRQYADLGFGVTQSKVLFPLNLKKSMLLTLSVALILVLGVMSYLGIYAYIEAHRPVPEAPMVKITYSMLGAPPSLTGSDVEQAKVATGAVGAAPTVGIPKPVEDSKAANEDAATQSELGAMSAGAATEAGTGGAALSVVEEVIPDKSAYVAVDKNPEPVRMPQPVYPEIAKKVGISGKVYVQMLIDIDGRVIRADIAKSSGNVTLDEAAVEAAKQWLFTPAIAPGGKPVRVWVMQPFTFKLN
ncbi:MAG: energy transducer TonB [Candidatus Edwardsbacteria bacterium]|nr:energy transducer TonB [Candidatus Edwardsbacteria bacterium]